MLKLDSPEKVPAASHSNGLLTKEHDKVQNQGDMRSWLSKNNNSKPVKRAVYPCFPSIRGQKKGCPCLEMPTCLKCTFTSAQRASAANAAASPDFRLRVLRRQPSRTCPKEMQGDRPSGALSNETTNMKHTSRGLIVGSKLSGSKRGKARQLKRFHRFDSGRGIGRAQLTAWLVVYGRCPGAGTNASCRGKCRVPSETAFI